MENEVVQTGKTVDVTLTVTEKDLWAFSMYHANAGLMGIFNLLFTLAALYLLIFRWSSTTTPYRCLLVICVLVLSLLFHFDHAQYVTLLPKSITTAIGMGISEELGGYVTITVAVIIITGIIGNVLAETICRVFKIEEPVAKGIAIGSSSHALGTAKALELGEIEGAMSSLSIAVAGILTVIAAPIFATLL